jgi:hypothetical protein
MSLANKIRNSSGDACVSPARRLRCSWALRHVPCRVQRQGSPHVLQEWRESILRSILDGDPKVIITIILIFNPRADTGPSIFLSPPLGLERAPSLSALALSKPCSTTPERPHYLHYVSHHLFFPPSNPQKCPLTHNPSADGTDSQPPVAHG